MSFRVPVRTLSAIVCLSMVTPAFAAITATSSSSARSRINFRDITNATYGVRRVYMTGKWSVNVQDAGNILTFKQAEKSVTLQVRPKDECAFQVIRIKAQKAWGGKNLDQSKAKIQDVILGRSTYRGFSWVVPGTPRVGDGKEYHWCVREDAKNATEVVASGIDQTTVTFIRDNLMRQLAVRNAIR